jgi:hypothetical protein
MFIEQGIFQKVKVGFLLVGCTYDHIDQMFNRFAITLKMKKVGILPSLIKTIKKSYFMKLVFHILEENVDM